MRLRPLLLGVLLGAACSSGGPSEGDVLVVSTVEIDPPGGSLTLGATLQLSATGKTSGGVAVPDRAVRWASSNAAIASVSSTGLVTAAAVGGPVTITATIDRAVGSVPVTVTPKPVASVTVAPDQAQIVVGGAQQFTATPRDAQGQPLDGRPVSWESDNPAVATVTVTGSAIGVSAGVTTIRATSEGKVGSAALTVTARPASRLGFTTQPANGVAGQPLGPVRVAVQDDIGGTVPSATTAITLSLGDNPGGATLGGTLTANAVQGVAIFADLVLNRAAAGYTLRASATPLSPALSNPFTIGAAAATALAITTQPSAAAQSGVALAQQPVVQLRDGLGNAVAQAGVTVTAALVTPGGSLGGTVAVATNASGTAAFTNLAIAGPAGNYTLRFTSAGLSEVVSAPIALAAGTATRLVITTQPSASAQSGVAFPGQPVVQLQDASGNAVAQAGVAVTAAIASGGGTIGGPATVTTNASGAAVFSGLLISGPAGTYTLAFSSPGLAGATSAPITLGAGGAAALQIVVQPAASAVNGVPLATQPAVRLVDGSGNPVSQAGVTVTAAAGGPSGSVTAGATATTDAAGIATFAGLTITGAVGTYTLSFTGAGLTGVTSDPINLGPAAAAALQVTRQPSSPAQSGVPFTVQPQVRLVDQSGNAVAQAGVTVNAALASGAGTLGGTLTATTSAAGIATFTDLSVTGPSGTYTIRFSATGLTPAVSAVIGVGAGVATQLAIATQPPASAQSGVALATQPVVQLRDAANNPVAQAGVAVTASLASGGGTLGGTLTVNTDASGTATFTDLSIAGTIGPRTLQFASAGLASAVSGTITLTPGPAAQLALTTAPSASVVNAQPFPQQPVVQLQDASGNAVAQAGVAITAAIASGGGTLGGTAVVPTSAAGVAAFADLSITGLVGARTLSFTAAALAPVTSGTVTVTPGAATQLGITTQPSSSAQSGVAFPVQPVLQLRDVSGNAVAQAGINVTAAIASGGGTLGGTAVVPTNASGVATFTDLSITGTSGARTLSFSAPGLTGATSSTITIGAGSATQITITTQPPAVAQSGVTFTTAPVVQLRDGVGNAVAQSGVSITVSIASGGGTLGGTLTQTTNSSGQATFTGLSISGIVGNRTLHFSSSGLSGATSNTIALSAGLAARLAMAIQPSPTAQSGVAFAQQPAIQVQDAAGNNVAANGTAITATIATGSGATLGGSTVAATNAGGLATFSNLSLTGTSGNFTLRFSASGLADTVSSTIALGAGAASVLSITTQPSSTVQNGIAFPQQPVIQLRDAASNPVAQAGVPVTVTILSGGPALSGTTTLNTNAAGQVTFTDLVITGTTGARTLIFAAPSFVSATSGTVTVTAGPPAALEITTQPSSTAQSGVVLPQQPSIQLVDQSGNPVSQAGVGVTAAIASGGGTLGGTTTVTTNASGVAAFTDLSIAGTTGTRTLGFTSAGLIGATSGNIALAAGPASQLALATAPSATAASGQALAQQPAIQLRDGAGNAVAQSGVTVTAAIATSPGGTPSLASATAITDGAGLATFSGLAITGLIGSYTLQFTSGALTPVTSGTISLSAGSATQLSLTTQPSATAQNTVAFAQQPVVQLRDAAGNAVSQAGVTVTASVASGTGTLGGTAAVVTNASGVATYTDLSLSGSTGSYTLQFSATGLAPVTSGTITLSAGPAASLSVFTEPSATATSGTPFATQPVVRVQDANGNNVSGVVVTAAIGTGPGGATLLGTATATSAPNGRATFSGLGITGLVGSYTLQFTAPGATSATSQAITLGAGAAARLALTTAPSGTVRNDQAFPVQPVVQVQDAAGNPVSASGLTVTAAIATGGGTLGGTVSGSTGGTGSLAFTNLRITGLVGDRTLSFSSAPLTGTSSSTISVQAGTATAIAIVTQPPASVASGATLAASVADLRDLSGNDVDSAGVAVTVAIASGGGTLGGTLTQTTSANGQASFGDLTITGTTGNRTLGYSGTSLTGATSSLVNVTAGAAATIAANSPTSVSGTAGAPVASGDRPSVLVTDGSGNPVSGVNVIFTVTAGGGTISPASPATVATDALGVATLTSWTLGGAAGTNTVTAASGALSGSPVTFNATGAAGTATQLVITTPPPGAARSGIALATAPVVQARDAGNNPVSGVSINASLNGGGTLGGTTGGTTDGAGNLTFTGLTITGTAGTKSLTFTSGALTPATSTDITLGAGAAAQLALTTQPGGAANGAPLSPQPVVQIQDAQGNPLDTAATVTATIASSPGGTPSLANANAATGGGNSATFGGLAITGQAGSYTLSFSAGSLTGVTSNALAITAGTPAAISFQTAPGGTAQSGVALATQPVVRVVDQSGNPVSGVTVNASLLTGTGGVSGGTSAVTDGNGDASFSGLVIDATAGTVTLRFTAGSLTLDSGNITVSAGPATQLAITAQPTGAQSATPLGTQPVVEFRDSGGNLVSTTASVTAVLVGAGGTLTGTVSVNAVGGVVTFTDLVVTGAGTYQIRFDTAGLPSVTSGSITITP